MYSGAAAMDIIKTEIRNNQTPDYNDLHGIRC